MSTQPTPASGTVTKPLQIDIPEPAVTLTPEQTAFRKAVIDEVVTSVFQQVQATLDADYAKKLTEAYETLDLQYGKKLQEEMEKFRRSLTPPTRDEISKLLNQVYETFEVKIPVSGNERLFTIVEVPQEIELMFSNKLEAAIVPRVKELESVRMILSEGDPESRIHHVLALLTKSLQSMAEITAIVLNPFGKEEGIDAEWVKKNMSSSRQLNVIQAQVHCNRLRDFFSQLFQLTNQ